MERFLVLNLEIAESEVDGDTDLHLPAVTQVLDQTGPHVHLELIKSDLASLFTLAVFEHYGAPGEHFNATRSHLNGAVLFVGAIIAVIVDRDADGQLLVVVAELGHVEGVWLPPRVQIVVGR